MLQVEKSTALIILGPDKVVVGDFCATIRRQRPPEPYKGKGVRFAGEVIKLKVGGGRFMLIHIPHHETYFHSLNAHETRARSLCEGCGFAVWKAVWWCWQSSV